MSKTYILEPTEVTFDGESPVKISDTSDIYDAITNDTIIEFSGTKLKYAGLFDSVKVFTVDGILHESAPEVLGQLEYDPDANETLVMYSSLGTYTVSIYTETEDDSDSDFTDISHNFAFSDHARNDLDGIDDLMDSVLGLNKSEESGTDEGSGGDIK